MEKEYIEVSYSFTGDDYVKEVIPAEQYKAFKEAFLNNTVFVFEYDRKSPTYRSGLNMKMIDMSKVVWIGY